MPIALFIILFTIVDILYYRGADLSFGVPSVATSSQDGNDQHLVRSDVQSAGTPASFDRVVDAFPIAPDTLSVSPIDRAESIPFVIHASGFSIHTYARNLTQPRTIAFDPRGRLLVADMAKGTIEALLDPDGDGVAQEHHEILRRLDFPNSFDFYNGDLYVAEKSGVYRYAYDSATMSATNKEKIVDFPYEDGITHQTRTVRFAPDGTMIMSIGSSCDVCKPADDRYATIVAAQADGSQTHVIARGVRNTVFFAFDEQGRIWGNDMGEDNLGPDLPPDELNLIVEGAHYGWPYCYDDRESNGFDRLFDCATTTSPVYTYPAHSAPLGIAFIHSQQFPSDWQGDILVALHGSWNRPTPHGYTVDRLIRRGDQIVGDEVFISGWLKDVPGINSAVTSPGRPVYLVFGPRGELYISDDKAGRIYVVEHDKDTL